jgi:hypothetical protein
MNLLIEFINVKETYTDIEQLLEEIFTDRETMHALLLKGSWKDFIKAKPFSAPI